MSAPNKAEAEGLAQELHSAEEGLALSTVVLTLHARTVEELDTARRRALSLIGTRLGIQPGKGRGYQKPLWQASLPLGQNAARRRAKRGSGNDPFVGQPYYIMLLFDAALEAQSC